MRNQIMTLMYIGKRPPHTGVLIITLMGSCIVGVDHRIDGQVRSGC